MLAFTLSNMPATVLAEQAQKEPVQAVRNGGVPAEKTANAPDGSKPATLESTADTAADEAVKPEIAPNSGSTVTPPEVNRGVPDDYYIGAGDVLNVAVWKEPEVSVPSVVVRPDGKISMPMIKEVQVGGLTTREVEKAITDQLTKFIAAADVTVIVSQINSKKIYLVGGIRKEGPMSYSYRMTALQAISEAGGLTDYAKKKKIYILRNENGKHSKLPFDYDAVLRGEHMEMNIVLLPGDTLVVPK